MNLKKIIGLSDYKTFAGPDWPSLDDIICGIPAADPLIQKEVKEFVDMMKQTYFDITIDGTILANNNQQRQKQIFFDKNYHEHPICHVPWNTMGVNNNGEVFICSSPSWIPKFVGNILHADNVYDVLNSESAQRIRQEIIAGRYFYCNNQICNFFGQVNPKKYHSAPQLDHQPLEFVSQEQLLVSEIPKNVRLIDPLGFYDFNHLLKESFCVISDSGTAAEEGIFYKVPNVSLRMSTERIETVESGATIISGLKLDNIIKSIETAVSLNFSAKYDLAENHSPSSVVINSIRSEITNFF
jgi:hypothetical protein